MRKRIRTCVWYSLILSPSTTAEVSRTSMPSMPRSVFAASWRAAWAASRHDCSDTPSRSMVLMTDIRYPLPLALAFPFACAIVGAGPLHVPNGLGGDNGYHLGT